MRVQNLIDSGMLALAKEPADNPDSLNFSRYILTLIEHDYPAKTSVMWNAVYRQFKMPVGSIILVASPSHLPEILSVFRRDSKYLGGGAGVGFKDEVIKYLDGFDHQAELVCSANFVLRYGRKLIGYNTDGLGYARSLEKVFAGRGEEMASKKAVILGAGGTANAVAVALAGQGVKIVILNRTVEKARIIAEMVNQQGNVQAEFGSEDLIGKEVVDADVVINVSTKGATGELELYSSLAPAVLPATEENIAANRQQAEKVLAQIPSQAIISDVILRKGLTPLLLSAKKAGFAILDGMPMVVNQGVEALWLVHGNELSGRGITKDQVYEVMKEAVELNC